MTETRAAASEKPANSLLDLMPEDTPEYMAPAWVSCIAWALSTNEIVAAFRADTGNQFQPATTPLERMIDHATGAQWDFVKAFTLWVNEHIWGHVPDCDCRNSVCGHKASRHTGEDGACAEPGCPCGPGGWT